MMFWQGLLGQDAALTLPSSLERWRLGILLGAGSRLQNLWTRTSFFIRIPNACGRYTYTLRNIN